MAYLTKADFTEKAVSSSRMLRPGGVVAPGAYVRRRKNLISSARLLERMKEASTAMQACKLDDACVPRNRPDLVGKPVPGKPGRVYRECTDEERIRRLENTVACARTALRKT